MLHTTVDFIGAITTVLIIVASTTLINALAITHTLKLLLTTWWRWCWWHSYKSYITLHICNESKKIYVHIKHYFRANYTCNKNEKLVHAFKCIMSIYIHYQQGSVLTCHQKFLPMASGQASWLISLGTDRKVSESVQNTDAEGTDWQGKVSCPIWYASCCWLQEIPR